MLAIRSTTTRAVAGVWIALLGVAFVSPSETKAACHDPVLARVLVEDASPNWLTGDGAMPDREAPSSPIPGSPCAGLRCSGDPVQPWTPPLVPPSSAERWGCLEGPWFEPDLLATDLFTESPCLRPSHGAPAPFHPPR